jgi:thioredoxin reductase
MPEDPYDVVVIGGGPAGLSAALVLGRCRRRVLVLDAGNPRNIASHGVHGFITREGTLPVELLSMAKEELKSYPVEVREATVMSVEGCDGAFTATLLDGTHVAGRKVLLATGVVDKLPKVEGVQKFYGKSVHHCPYCDGWEHSNGRIAVYARGKSAVGLALKMKGWSEDIVVVTDGPSRLNAEERARLAKYDVRVVEKKIKRLDGDPPQMKQIIFDDGSCLERTSMFFGTGNTQRSALFQQLGCEVSRKGALKTRDKQRSNIDGVFVAGDAAEDSQYVIIAAAHGARAAMAINNDLLEEEFRS